MEFQPIEKKFKKKCSRCGEYARGVKGSFGHNLCNRCARIKNINQVNAISIPSFLLKKHGLKDVQLYLEDHPDGVLIRKATADEVKI